MTFEQDITVVISAVDRLRKQKTELAKQVSSFDKQVNDMYHVIELLPLSASNMAKVTKRLREILNKRREAKENLIRVSNFLSASIEKLKPQEIHDANCELREEKYRKEAQLVFDSMFS